MRRHLKGDIVNFHEPSFEALVRTASNHHPFLNTPGSVIIILRHATAGVVSVGCPLAVTAMVTVCEGEPAPIMLRGLDPDWWQVEEGVSMVVRPSLPSRSPGVTGMPQCRCGVCSEQ